MVRKVEAEVGRKIKIEDGVKEIYDAKVVPYSNGARISAQKRNIGKRVIVIILED